MSPARTLAPFARWTLAACALAAVACREPTRTVSVTGRYVRLTVNGMVSDPYEMYGDTVSAHVLGADGAGFQTVPGFGGYGYLYVPEVPEGEYYLRREAGGFALFVVTSASELDLSQIVVGRGDVLVPTATTTLELSVTGLEAWQAGDELQAIASNLGMVLGHVDGLASTGTLAVGARALAPLRLDFARHALPLVEDEYGDRLSLLHLRAETSPEGVPYRAVRQVFNAAPFTMEEGGAAVVAGAFSPVSELRSARIEWRSSAFAALAPEVSPTARVMGATFAIDVLPRAEDFGDYDVGPDLLVQEMAEPADLSASLSYGAPFPDGFDAFPSTHYVYGVEYRAPGAERGLVVLSANRVESTLAALDDDPVLTPRISPPRAPRLQGADAFAPAVGVGLTPKLSWTPPALGRPTGYGVRLARLVVDAEKRTVSQPVALILTPHPEVVVPPAVLVEGEVYYARIVAFDEPSRDLATVPFRYQLPNAGADTLTATFTP